MPSTIWKNFQKGYQAVQKGGKLGPDAAQKWVDKKLGGDGVSDAEPKSNSNKPGADAYIFTSPKDQQIYTWQSKEGFWLSKDGRKRLNKKAGIRQWRQDPDRMPKNTNFKEDQAMAKKQMGEGLGDMAHMAEKDHEVQMARADLYKLAKYAIKLHDMLKNVSEADGLEGWVQSKITKSSDYISSVYHHLDYDQATGEINDDEVNVAEGKSPHKKGTKKYKKHMAAMHAESASDPYKAQLRAKLESKKKK